MALTADQAALVRYYMGYSVAGDAQYFVFRELAYTNRSWASISLDDPAGGGRLAHLSVVEEARITGFFLPNLQAREAEIQTAVSNLDTDKASVWTRNRTEVSDRRAVFTDLRIELCRFLGFPPGPGLSAVSRVTR